MCYINVKITLNLGECLMSSVYISVQWQSVVDVDTLKN